MSMDGVNMKLTEKQLKQAIEFWYNHKVCDFSHGCGKLWHKVEECTPMPRSDDYRLDVTFGESKKK